MKFKEFLEKVNKDEIISKWTNNANIRIKASEKFQEIKTNKSIEEFENEYLNHF